MTDNTPFRTALRSRLLDFVAKENARFPANETVAIDLHCHDLNSDVPDELLGRILHWPETWVSTDDVHNALRRVGIEALTITNHNNARSCWDLQNRGVDVLPAAEFTCVVQAFDVHIHVLTYGLSPAEETRLNALRHNLLDFLTFAAERRLVTVLAHPLYFYSTNQVPTTALIEYLTVLFDHFEGLNGQRDTWQNLLVIEWLKQLDAQRLEDIANRVGIPPELRRTCPQKAMTGGSDDHMAMFVGLTGTLAHVPDLREQRQTRPLSALVLEALRDKRVAPFGTYAGEDRLAASFLDYFCQIVRHAGDPGLVRLLLHQGSAGQKFQALLIANAMAELRRHRYTSRFIEAAHEALHGQHLGFMQKYAFSKEYRPLAKELDRIATVQRTDPHHLNDQLKTSIPLIFNGLIRILGSRIAAKIAKFEEENASRPLPGPQTFIENLELPADIRTLLSGKSDHPSNTGGASLSDIVEGLPFPALAASVIAGSSYASARVLFANRDMLNDFSATIGCHQHPQRILWLTDTFFDRNGVASTLRLMHQEAVRRNLPMDFAVCHGTEPSAPHLHILEPVLETAIPWYRQQPVRAFDIMALQQLFMEGAYDRIICSTEGLMGAAALYLKSAFSVPAHFYVHTDWVDFSHRTLRLDVHNVDRVRRLLRAFYRMFDGLFVLNSEQMAWLQSDAMGINPDRLTRTAHWPDACFRPGVDRRQELFPGLRKGERVVLFAGRVSNEKGVMELPAMMKSIQETVPKARLVVAGTGPAEERLRLAVPDGILLSWVDAERLADVYASADVLVLPSRFDTFGCVVLEALACGLPVVAYRTKGPADIIEDGISGFTVREAPEFAPAVVRILSDDNLRSAMGRAAIDRARQYSREAIVDGVLHRVLPLNP